MQRRIIILLLAVAAVLSADGRPAETAPVQHYRNRGIAFDYPADWKVTRDERTAGGNMVALRNARSGIVSLGIFAASLKISLEDYMAANLKNMATSLPPNTVFRQTGTTVASGMTDVKFMLKMGVDEMRATVNLTRHELGNLTVFCITQVPDDDRARVQAAFDLVRRTLAVSSGGSPGK